MKQVDQIKIGENLTSYLDLDVILLTFLVTTYARMHIPCQANPQEKNM